ncbi:MAG: hypothetical protein F4W90_07740 [Gammaproteobacteria bacterium]|nr:hypothetical protein [Gammaproteobacteria bacterium]
MMVRMRNAAQSWIAKFVAGVLIVVLVLFGFGAFNLFGVDEPAVASVNGEDITERRLAAEIERTKQDIRNTYGDSVTDAQLDEYVDEAFTLRRLIDTELFMQAASELALTLSDTQFEKILRTDPTFQTDGEFDEELLRGALERGGMSAQTLRLLQEQSTVRSKLLRAIEDSSFSTNAETRLMAKFDKQVRDISTLEFTRAAYDDPDNITRDDVELHYDLNHDLYMTLGSFDFEYVQVDASELVPEVDLSDEELAELHAADIIARNSNAKRHGRHLLIKIDENRSEADALTEIVAIKQRISDGESLADLAKELSEDAGSKDKGGDLGMSDRAQWVKEFSDSLWSLEVGEISSPVKTTFGYHLIELLEVEEVELPTLEENIESLKEDHRQSLVKEAMADAYEEMDKLAFEQSDSLGPVAEAFAKPIETVEDYSGVQADDQLSILQFDEVKQAFLAEDVIDNGFNSRVVRVEDLFIAVGRMTDREAPSLKPIDDVYDDIRDMLAEEAADAARDAKHQEVLETLRDDQDFDAAAAAVASSWVVREKQLRDDFEVDPAVLEAAFAQALPTTGERVITEATSEFTPSKYVVVVSRQELADYALLEQAEQETIDESAVNDAKTRAVAAFVSSLRSEASIESELFSYE